MRCKHISGALIILGTYLVVAATYAKDTRDPWPYWDHQTYLQLIGLTPELPHPRLASLPPGGQSLWEQGQMRIHKGPWDSLEGDFSGSGTAATAVLLAVGGSGETGEGARHFLLIAEQNRGRWRRLLLQPLDDSLQRLDDVLYASETNNKLYNGQLIRHKASGLIFDAKRHIVCVTSGEKQRLTKAATMTTRFLPNGEHESSGRYGYVLEKELILPFRWQQGAFHQDEPCWYLDPESEDALRNNGISPEAEREFFRIPKKSWSNEPGKPKRTKVRTKLRLD